MFLGPRGPLIEPSSVRPSAPIFPEFIDELKHCRQASGTPQIVYFPNAHDVRYPNSDRGNHFFILKVTKKTQRTTGYTSIRVISPSKASCSRWTSCRISLGDRTIQNQSHRRKDKCCFVFRLICFEGLRDKMQNKSNWHIFWFLLWVVLLQLNRVGSKESGELKRLGVGKSGQWTI